jgi:hypothetical protein
MNELRFHYRLKPVKTALFSLFFIGCLIGMFYYAYNNDRGMIINGIFRLDRDNATIFYFVMASIVFLVFFYELIRLALALGQGERHIVIGRNELLVPHGRQESKTVPYRDIQSLNMQGTSSLRSLQIKHHGGKVLIFDDMLPMRSDLDKIGTTVAANVVSARAAQRS